MLTAVGLPQLASRLDEEAHWNRMLSLGEQQRLGLARALLHAPQYLFLDEATASLDEPSEAALYRLLEAEIAGDHHRLDRPSLDAGGVPSAQCRADPRRRSLHAARTAERRQAVIAYTPRLTASAAATAGGGPSGARHRQTPSAAARPQAPARTGTTSGRLLETTSSGLIPAGG